MRDTVPSRNRPVVTWAIVLVNVLVFALELMVPEPVFSSLNIPFI